MDSADPSSTADRLGAVGVALRRERENARLSLSELSRKAGIAKSTLSQLESGDGNPSVETLWALCLALNIKVSALLDPPRPRVHIVRVGEGAKLRSAVGHYSATLLATCPPTAAREIYRVAAEPGRARRSEPHMAGVIEHVIVCTGRANVGLVDDAVELRPGDYMAYPGDEPHVFEALEPGTTAVLVSEYN